MIITSVPTTRLASVVRDLFHMVRADFCAGNGLDADEVALLQSAVRALLERNDLPNHLRSHLGNANILCGDILVEQRRAHDYSETSHQLVDELSDVFPL